MSRPHPIRRLARAYLPEPVRSRLRATPNGHRSAQVEAAPSPTAQSTAGHLTALYRRDRYRTLTAVEKLVSDSSSGAHDLFEAVRFAFACGDLELARSAHSALTRRAEQHPNEWPGATTEIEWLLPWLARPTDTVDAPNAPETNVALAVLDYRQPSRAKSSQNIGDHIQTVAALGQLARFTNVRFHGPTALTEFATQLQHRVLDDRRVPAVRNDVSLLAANRDATNYELFPPRTWVLAYGWYMHPLFGLRHDFPLHPSLRPIFVSFHCNKPKMLTNEALEYLRRYAPIGCRDWTTVALLLARRVPAFFSGCLTTTVDTVFPERRPTATEGTIYVDVPADQTPTEAATARHSYPAVKRQGLGANLRHAMHLLERYRRHSDVVTRRLHCYLPARSLGVPAAFRPKNRDDVRFTGLVDIDERTFDGIRYGLLDRLAPVLTAILGGHHEDDVYDIWRMTNAADVAQARARLG